MLTPAHAVPVFRERWQRPGLRLAPLLPFQASGRQKKLARARRMAAKRGRHGIARRLFALERKWVANCPKAYQNLLDEHPWDVVLATHIHLPFEVPLMNAAYVRGIPTVGLVNSWDNVYKGINAHPDHAVVWSDVNKNELIDFEGYPAERITPIGPPAFDPYFRPENQWSREELCRRFDLDPERPILLYATLGQYVSFFEETYLLEALLQGIEEDCFARRPQILCRLHPWSRQELFEPYRDHPDVRFSRYETYIPTLNWCPTRAEVVLAGNLLNHSDVCVTPGSTMALEAALFDTPTLVPIFNAYQPTVWEDYYTKYCLAWHFGRLVREEMLPVARTFEEMIDWINRYLAEPSLYREGRRRIVEEYVQFTDGNAVERLADVVEQVASGTDVPAG